MISWHFRPLRWVSDYRTDKVDSINFFLHIVKIACQAWDTFNMCLNLNRAQRYIFTKTTQTASLGVGLSTNRVDSIKLFFLSSPKYDFLAFQTASLGVGLSYG